MRGGDGEMGGWGEGERGRWGDGEMGGWGQGEMGGWEVSCYTFNLYNSSEQDARTTIIFSRSCPTLREHLAVNGHAWLMHYII